MQYKLKCFVRKLEALLIVNVVKYLVEFRFCVFTYKFIEYIVDCVLTSEKYFLIKHVVFKTCMTRFQLLQRDFSQMSK